MKDRSQYVSINGEKSSNQSVISGVPQGSVLGPTLFIYVINDLPDIIECLSKIFADDAKVYNQVISQQDKVELQNNINNIDSWTEDWLLGLNYDKCNILHLGKNNPHQTYTIGTGNNMKNLNTTYKEKDLGVHIDPLLKFDSYVSEMLKNPYVAQ